MSTRSCLRSTCDVLVQLDKSLAVFVKEKKKERKMFNFSINSRVPIRRAVNPHNSRMRGARRERTQVYARARVHVYAAPHRAKETWLTNQEAITHNWSPEFCRMRLHGAMVRFKNGNPFSSLSPSLFLFFLSSRIVWPPALLKLEFARGSSRSGTALYSSRFNCATREEYLFGV